MSERNRAILFQRLAPVVGDEDAVGEMLSCYPARNTDEPISKDFLRAELTVFRAEVQAEFAAVRSEFGTEMVALRTDVASEFAELRSEVQSEFAELRSEMQSEFAAVRNEFGAELVALRADVDRRITSSSRWIVGVMLAMNTGLVAAVAAVA